MIEQVCAFIHNYFYGRRYAGTFTIEDGALEVEGLLEGQYFRIRGSRMNDGVYVYPATALTDETFVGEIWEMRPPKAFLALVTEIEAWQAKYGGAVAGPYKSERFGDYSYSLKDGGAGSAAAPGWQGAFGARLNEWRKLA